MDHLKVLKEKVVSLRAEIAQINELNEQYRRRKDNATVDQIAHGQRHERLQVIQKELGRLADLGRSVHTANQIRERDRIRLEQMRNAKAS